VQLLSPHSLPARTRPLLRHQKTIHSTHQHKLRGLRPITASPRHRPLPGRKNPANAQIPRRLQKCQRPHGHPRYRSKTPGKNEEISNRRQGRNSQYAQLANAKPKPRAPTKSAPTKSAPTKSVAAQVTKKTPPPQPSSAPSP